MRTGRKAFTLLELLVAMSLMVVVAACLYSSLYTAFRARRSASAAVEPSMTAANAIDILKQDISGALPPKGILAGTFLGMNSTDGKGGDSDSVSFYTTRLHTREGKRPYGGIDLIELVLAQDDNDEGDVCRLVRRVTPSVISPRVLEPDEQVLCRNVRSLSIRYFDGFDWLDDWDSTAHGNELPLAVEIGLQIAYKTSKSDKEAQPHKLTQTFLIPCRL